MTNYFLLKDARGQVNLSFDTEKSVIESLQSHN